MFVVPFNCRCLRFVPFMCCYVFACCVISFSHMLPQSYIFVRVVGFCLRCLILQCSFVFVYVAICSFMCCAVLLIMCVFVCVLICSSNVPSCYVTLLLLLFLLRLSCLVVWDYVLVRSICVLILCSICLI